MIQKYNFVFFYSDSMGLTFGLTVVNCKTTIQNISKSSFIVIRLCKLDTRFGLMLGTSCAAQLTATHFYFEPNIGNFDLHIRTIYLVTLKFLGLCPSKNIPSEKEHNKDVNMKIIVLHFTPEDYDIERFVELTDVKIDNLIDFEFEVYDHNEVY